MTNKKCSGRMGNKHMKQHTDKMQQWYPGYRFLKISFLHTHAHDILWARHTWGVQRVQYCAANVTAWLVHWLVTQVNYCQMAVCIKLTLSWTWAGSTSHCDRWARVASKLGSVAPLISASTGTAKTNKNILAIVEPLCMTFQSVRMWEMWWPSNHLGGQGAPQTQTTF